MKTESLPLTDQSVLDRILSFGNSNESDFRISSLFLGLAVWNTFNAMITLTLWTRVLSSEAFAYMTPLSMVLPIIICLSIAILLGSTVRNYLRTFVLMSALAAITIACWSPSSEKWLNTHGHSYMD